jgi:hypothetical protein
MPFRLALALLTLASSSRLAPCPAALTAQERAQVTLEVRPSPAFQKAVERGTRTSSGEPGPRYWQQRVDYDIRALVDPHTRLLKGQETVTYTNNSPDTLKTAFFHLYQNLFSAGALNTRRVPITGGLTLDSLTVDGQRLELAPEADPSAAAATNDTPAHRADAANVHVQGTLMRVRLPRPLPPGRRATFSTGWHFTIPAGGDVPRMGMVDSTTAQIAQWYPQIATYDDLSGWDWRPYLSNGEFYLEYGTFDLAITVPAGTVVAATGTLENPEEVLTEAVRERLARAETSDETMHILTAADFGPGKATRGQAGQLLTWRFHAENVRDAAFALSDHYLWDAASTDVRGPGDSGAESEAPARRTMVHALYRPNARTWTESAKMTKDAIEVFSRNIYLYPYPHITSTEGLVGGMEYPMIVFVRSFGSEQQTQQVIAHELGHEWFPMMVGSDETSYAWMDEGVNTFITIFAVEHYFPRSTEREEVRNAYRAYTRTSNTTFSMMDAPDAVAVGGSSVAILGYRKPAVALLALHEILGHQTFDRALTAYTERWLYKHPTPWDFFHTFEQVAGRDLDWFWQPWFYGTGISDLAIERVEVVHGDAAENECGRGPAGCEADGAGRRRVEITVRNEGTVLSPVVARNTTTDGRTVTAEAPATVWFDGSRTAVLVSAVEVEVAKVELDPEGLFSDVDPTDDVWAGGAAATRSARAGGSRRGRG